MGKLMIPLIIFFTLGCIESNNNLNKNQISTIEVITGAGSSAIELSRPVTLPINQSDAYFINNESECLCNTNLTLEDDYWVGSCCEEYPDCSIKISVETGNVTCYHFG